MKRLGWFGLALLAVGLGVGAARFYLLVGVPALLFLWIAGFALPKKHPDLARGTRWAAVLGSLAGLVLSGMLIYEIAPVSLVLLGAVLGIPVVQGIGAGVGSGASISPSGWFSAIGGSYLGVAVFFRWLQFCLALPTEQALLSPELSFTLLLWGLVFVPLSLLGALGAGLILTRAKR